MRPAVKAPGNAGGTAMVIMSSERFITSAAGFFLIFFSTIENIIPMRAMKERAPIYLSVSMLNLKSTGFGCKMARSSSPLLVLKPVRDTTAFIFSFS